MDIELLVREWIKWKDRLDEIEIRRDCGFKPFGVEYRIMLEGAAVQRSGGGPDNEARILRTDHAWRNVFMEYPKEMDAVYVFYLRKKSFRAVRQHMQCSQHMSRNLVKRGEDLLRGALCVVMDISRF